MRTMLGSLKNIMMRSRPRSAKAQMPGTYGQNKCLGGIGGMEDDRIKTLSVLWWRSGYRKV